MNVYYVKKSGRKCYVFRSALHLNEPSDFLFAGLSEALSNEIVRELNRAYELGIKAGKESK